MASKTKQHGGRMVSPYSLPTLREAYDYWCARVLPGQKALGHIKRKPSFDTWCGKMGHEDRFKEFHTNAGAASAAQVRGKDGPGLLQALVEALATAGVEIDMSTIEDDLHDDRNGEYRERRDQPADCARNGVLWVLNSQGLLAEAIERAEGDYITQAEGTELLTETFGPLER